MTDRSGEHRHISLPRDLGLHRGARSEWWYFTGRLVSSSGMRWSYMLSFFRSSYGMELSRFAHLLIHSCDATPWVACERALSPFGDRTRIGIEGLDIDYDGWTAELDNDRFRIRADYEDHAIDLWLSMGDPMPTGRDGLIDIGRIRTCCYSLPRLDTEGELEVEGRSFRVTGTSWFDHEWGSIPLPHKWYWWGINLEDGSDLVLRDARGERIANLRRPDGSVTTTTRVLGFPQRYWQAPSGGKYPVEWVIGLPEFEMELEIAAQKDECEAPFHVVYWEGLCSARAKTRDGEQWGSGYMELVGHGTGMAKFITSRLARLAADLVYRDRRTNHGRVSDHGSPTPE